MRLLFFHVKWCPIGCSRPDLIIGADLTFPLKRPQIDHVFEDWVQEDSAIYKVTNLARLVLCGNATVYYKFFWYWKCFHPQWGRYENLWSPQRFHSIYSIHSALILETAIFSIISICTEKKRKSKQRGCTVMIKAKINHCSFVDFYTSRLKSTSLCHWFSDHQPSTDAHLWVSVDLGSSGVCLYLWLRVLVWQRVERWSDEGDSVRGQWRRQKHYLKYW